MISPPFIIKLILVGVRWDWAIENDEQEVVAYGDAPDYLLACQQALVAFDKAVKEEQKEI